MNKDIFSEEIIISYSSKVAAIIGLNEAIVLQYIHECLLKNKELGVCCREDKYWVAKSLKDWQKEVFIFWNVATVKRTFLKLQRMGILIGCKFKKSDFDHTKWYTIDYEEFDAIISGKLKNK